MTPKAILVAIALGLLPAAASAQQWNWKRDANLNPICQATGSGMDPRCVGDTVAGGISDMTTARQQYAIEHGMSAYAWREPRGRVVIMDRR